MVTQEQLWLQYMQALASKVQLQTGEALQAIYPWTEWSWGGRDPVAGTLDYEEWLTLNVVPSDPYQNTNDGAATTQGFDTTYGTWMNMLALTDLEHDAHYNQLQDDFTNVSSKLTKDYLGAQNVWRNQTGGTSPDFNTWLNQPPQFGTLTQLNEDKTNVTAAQGQLDQYRGQIQNPLSALQAAYSNQSFQGNITDPNSQKSVQVRLWNTDPQNPYSYVEDVTGNNFGGDATKGTSDTLSITSASSSYSYSDFYASGGGAWWDDFIGVEAESSYEKIDWSSFAEDYSISVAWQDLRTVSITPDAWYTGVTTFASGPYFTGFSEYKGGAGNFFFGPGGALSRIYSGMVVAYRPTIKITASEAFASYMYEKWQTEVGIEIGPFFFGGESSQTSQQSTATSSEGTLTIEGHGDWPLIVAMKSAWTQPPT